MPQLLRGRFAAHCVGQTTQIGQLVSPPCKGCPSRRWVIPPPVARKLHQLAGPQVFFGGLLDVVDMLLDAFVQAGQLAQCIAHHSVAPSGQVFEVFVRLAAHGGGFEWQHDAQFR